MTFLGYRIGRNYRRDTGRAYIGTRPSPASVQSICRRVSALTTRRDLLPPPEVVVGRLNRLLTGWANYFTLGQVSPAYEAVDRHATRRLRQWLCRKHRALVREPDAGDPHVRFDERRLETESWRGVRHRHRAKAAGNSYPLPPTATAPVVDSTSIEAEVPRGRFAWPPQTRSLRPLRASLFVATEQHVAGRCPRAPRRPLRPAVLPAPGIP